jgi:hypothetical protein
MIGDEGRETEAISGTGWHLSSIVGASSWVKRNPTVSS